MNIYQTKCCSKCNIVKPITNFSKSKNRKDGHHPTCKQCVHEHYTQNKDKILLKNKKYYSCNKESILAQSKEYRNNNKDKKSESDKKYREENKEKISNTKKEYYLNNKDKHKQWQENNKHTRNERRQDRRKTDPLWALAQTIRVRITESFRVNGYTKRSKTYEILGCSFEEFYIHIEKQFTDGMTWDNRGKWHLDHKIPISLATTEEELIKLNHYTNIQPLWAIDNYKKGNKLL
jgi:hypothetical protein